VKKILLHICCGPCAIYPLKVLKQQGFQVEGFFYNPNIQPYDEYNNRLSALLELQKMFNLIIHYGEYEQKLYEEKVKDVLDKKNQRCYRCFQLRLDKSCSFAIQNGFDYFTTTLLVSPYQEQQSIKEIGEGLCRSQKVKFFFYDFREGFRQAQKEAKELGLYRQKYCGCFYSLKERGNS